MGGMGGVHGSREDLVQPAYADVDPFEHERRFILTRGQAVAFYAAIGSRASIELYDKTRPIAYTRTTYIDTDDLVYLRSCDGPVARRLRVREYAMARALGETPVLSGIACLELKQNTGTARSKVRLTAPPSVLRRILESRGELPDGSAGLEPLAALQALRAELCLRSIAPRLTTWYRRTCMTGEGGRVRITLDENLTYCRAQVFGDAGQPVEPTEVIASGPARILEIKHWGTTPDWLAQALKGLAPAPGFSKFKSGMLALQQHTPAVPDPQDDDAMRTVTPATIPPSFASNGPSA
jgi:hypothetical protein